MQPAQKDRVEWRNTLLQDLSHDFLISTYMIFNENLLLLIDCAKRDHSSKEKQSITSFNLSH